MMHRRFRQICCALKEHSSLSYAKIATVGGFCDINLIIVKATAPDDLPLSEKYIQELLKIFSISSSSFHSFSASLSCRFAKTHCWKVALKCLLLLHRLLRSLPERSPFRTELLWTRSNGLLSLYPCRFRDDSSSTPEDYTIFIRSYAQLLDEALQCFCLDNKETEDEVEDEDRDDDDVEEETAQRRLNHETDEVAWRLEVLPQLQSLIDRVMDCRPNGAAARSFIVQSAMKYIIRDSFICYTTFRREVVLVLDNLIQMPYPSCVSAFGIYKRAALQSDQLSYFYEWCRAKGLCGSYEYPLIDRIPQIQIRALESFLNGMWQLTESSSSTTTSPSSWTDKKSSSTEDDGDKSLVRRDIVVTTQWEKFEENGFQSKLEMEPLIQLEDGGNDDWEALLEASLSLDFPSVPRNKFFINSDGFNYGYEFYGKEACGEENHQWQIQVYNPIAFNPFCQPCSMTNYIESFGSNAMYSWGL